MSVKSLPNLSESDLDFDLRGLEQPQNSLEISKSTHFELIFSDLCPTHQPIALKLGDIINVDTLTAILTSILTSAASNSLKTASKVQNLHILS